MKVVSTINFPWKPKEISDDALRKYIKMLIVSLQKMYSDLANAINYNENFSKPRYYSQPSMPIPSEGELLVWKDSDASSGYSSHYLVYNDGGTIITFASEQKVP